MKTAMYVHIHEPAALECLRGLEQLGEVVIHSPEDFRNETADNEIDLCVLFSMAGFCSAVWLHYRKRCVPVVIVEQGHTDRMHQFDDGQQYAIGRDGIERNGKWERQFFQVSYDRLNWLPESAPEDRRLALGLMYPHPQSNPEGYVLFLGQKPHDAQHFGMDVANWISEAMREVRKYTDRRIVYRVHPKDGYAVLPDADCDIHRPEKLTLAESFVGAHSIVTFNSNAGLQALILGHRVYCHSRALYAPMGLQDVSGIETDPHCPRAVWNETMNRICYAQWTMAELATEAPWRYVLSHIPQRVAA